MRRESTFLGPSGLKGEWDECREVVEDVEVTGSAWMEYFRLERREENHDFLGGWEGISISPESSDGLMNRLEW